MLFDFLGRNYFSGDFLGIFWISQEPLFSKNSTKPPLNLKTSPIFTNTPCKPTCLYNTPSLHIVEISRNESRK